MILNQITSALLPFAALPMQDVHFASAPCAFDAPRDAAGRFHAVPHATVPLCVRRAKSARHVKAWNTRREKRAAWVDAHCAAILGSL